MGKDFSRGLRMSSLVIQAPTILLLLGIWTISLNKPHLSTIKTCHVFIKTIGGDVPWLTIFVTSDLSGESIGFATTTTRKPHSNSPLIVGAVAILLRRGRVRFSPMLRSILFVLHWTYTPIIARPISRVFIPNPAHVNQEWKLANTLVIHNLLHFRSQVV